MFVVAEIACSIDASTVFCLDDFPDARQRRAGYRRRPSGSRHETEDRLLPDRRFFCESCGKSYKWKESLFKHKRVECGKLPQFSCEVCGYRFMHKHHLLKHMTSIHQLAPMNGAVMLAFQ
ncbi:uncharacterized protein LOC143149473 [Ptiloglossa arizonensis]|uniref:uncharacterized protein LOC143149473 n=1 Tax=Ptiloglossa arizonensis TaxID=3350558 RepID=UPI003F9ED603